MNHTTLQFEVPSFDVEIAIFESTAERKTYLTRLLLTSFSIHFIMIAGYLYFLSPDEPEFSYQTNSTPLQFSLVQVPLVKSTPATVKQLVASPAETVTSEQNIITTNENALFSTPSLAKAQTHEDEQPLIKDIKPETKSVADAPIPNIKPPEITEDFPIDNTPIKKDETINAIKEIEKNILSNNLDNIVMPTESTKDAAITTESAPSEIDLETLDLNSLISRKSSYPKIALKRGIQGTVELNIIFGSDGFYESINIIGTSGSDILDKAAINAAKKSLKDEYRPTLSDYSVQIQIQYALAN